MQGRVSQWCIPSLSQWLWLVIWLVLLTPAWRTAMVSSDGDTCMHWAVGEWMLQHNKIIRADVFSHTRYDAPIISKEWLSEIIFALAGRVAGLDGSAIVAALVIATTFALLHWRLLREGSDLLVATGVTLLAAWPASTHWLARPHAFSFLMTLLWHDAIRRHERDHNLKSLIIWLTVMAALWVNLHGAFLAGFFVLGAYWLGALVERDWPKLRRLTTAGIVAAAATLLNPNGWLLHLHNIEFLRSKYYINYLAEYASTNFQSADGVGFLAWLALLFFVLTLCRRRLKAGEIFVLISWGYFGLFSVRNIPLLAILTAPIVAQAVSASLREHARQRYVATWLRLSDRIHSLNDNGRGWPVVMAVVVATLIFWPRYPEIPADKWPVAAVQYIKDHPADFRGNMLNQYIWGGYLMVALPEHRTFVDGRADFFGKELLKEFDLATSLRPGWQAPLEKYRVTWTLMPTDHPLNLALALLPGWKKVYSDSTATIWRKSP